MIRAAAWWRHVALAGGVAGLLASPHLSAPPGWALCTVVAATALAALGRALLTAERATAPSVAAWLCSVWAVGVLVGLGAGEGRLARIDGGALRGPVGAQVSVSGFVDAVPRRAFGEVRVPLDTPDGRVVLVAPEPIGTLPVGRLVRIRGRLAEPDPFRREELTRLGAALELRAERVDLTGTGRGGIAGAIDGMRGRAESALGEGMDGEQAALARGFVLGQDDLIDPLTRDAFKRSGLAHLLAVSGQNVMLLAILAGVLLGAVGVPLRSRLVLTLALIALYVPIAGAGPSIQRAGVVGAAGLLAVLAGRPSQRAYLVLLAAAVTLLINPRFGSDVGWQLSFAAVIGIAVWAAPLRDLLRPWLEGRLPARLAAPLAEGAGLAVAATLATAPLMAHHFEQVSLAAIPANLIAMAVVGPVMWLGMLIGLLGQLPALPLAPLGAIEGALIEVLARIAEAFAQPGWAQLSIPPPSPLVTAGVYAALGLLGAAALAPSVRRRGLVLPPRLALALATLCLAALAVASLEPSDREAVPPNTLRITALDVGQGDAILLQPPSGAPVLVDGGPPGEGIAEALRDQGVERLRAVFVTHDELDHAGGLFEVLSAVPVAELVHGRPAPELEAAARAAGARVLATAEGSSFRFGRLELDVLWPPRDSAPAEDRNLDSLVMAARFAGYDALLSGDAEAEATHLDPGPFDLLKIAHHGSDDAGLASLLGRSVPRVALIGVGADNSYGHPTPDTLTALAEHGVCILRTDLDGASTVELGPAGVRAWTAAGLPPADRPGCEAAAG